MNVIVMRWRSLLVQEIGAHKIMKDFSFHLELKVFPCK